MLNLASNQFNQTNFAEKILDKGMEGEQKISFQQQNLPPPQLEKIDTEKIVAYQKDKELLNSN